jgi:hypothetical protein
MQGDWLSMLLSWWPFVVMIIAWIVVMRFSRPRSASGATMIELYEQQIAETRRTNATLERMATALEKRA